MLLLCQRKMTRAKRSKIMHVGMHYVADSWNPWVLQRADHRSACRNRLLTFLPCSEESERSELFNEWSGPCSSATKSAGAASQTDWTTSIMYVYIYSVLSPHSWMCDLLRLPPPPRERNTPRPHPSYWNVSEAKAVANASSPNFACQFRIKSAQFGKSKRLG